MGLLETLRNIEFEPTPMSMGLLQMGAQMLANSSNQPAPVSFGSVLGHGINGFTQGAGSVMQQRVEEDLKRAQIQHYKDLGSYYTAGGGKNAPHLVGTILGYDKDGNPIQVGYKSDASTVDLLGPMGLTAQPKNLDKGQFVKDGKVQLLPGYEDSSYRAEKAGESGKTDAQVIEYNGMDANGNPVNGAVARKGEVSPSGYGAPQVNIGASDPNALAEVLNNYPPNHPDRIAIENQLKANGEKLVPIRPGQNPVAIEAQKQAAQKQADNLTANQEKLPMIRDLTSTQIKHINELINHPGLKGVIGLPNGLSLIPGTKESDFKNRLDQINNEAFLSAFNELRGTGAISDAEGQKATSAKHRMQTATSEAAFKEAADEYVGILQKGISRAYAAAQGQQYKPENYATPPATQSPVSGFKVLEIK